MRFAASVCIVSMTLFGFGSRAALGQGFGDLTPHDGAFIEAEPTLIVIPKSRDCVLGYSAKTDDWDRVELKSELPKNAPVVVSGDLAVFVHDGVCHGFSAETGRWASIKLADSKEPAIPIIGGNVAAVRHADDVYGFGTRHGVWGKATLSKGSRAQPAVGSSLLKIVDGETMYVFSETSKRFSGVNLTDGETVRAR